MIATTTSARPLVRGARVTLVISTGIFAAMMLASGIGFLAGPESVVRALRELGYPDYLRPVLGIAKLAGVIALVSPRVPKTLREWAYAGFAFDLIGALVSHVAAHSGPSKAAPAIVALVLLFTSYGLRRAAAKDA
jgi:hypothetical protein